MFTQFCVTSHLFVSPGLSVKLFLPVWQPVLSPCPRHLHRIISSGDDCLSWNSSLWPQVFCSPEQNHHEEVSWNHISAIFILREAVMCLDLLQRVSRKQPVGQKDVLQVIFMYLFVWALICLHHCLPPPPSSIVFARVVVSWWTSPPTSGLSGTGKVEHSLVSGAKKEIRVRKENLWLGGGVTKEKEGREEKWMRSQEDGGFLYVSIFSSLPLISLFVCLRF